jgi:tripartite-type tricarboxylate transporter receptor subunit TctC
VVENVTGSGGNLATDRVAKAAPDGYTLLLGTSGPFVIHPSLYSKLPFDPVKDFEPITQLCFTPNSSSSTTTFLPRASRSWSHWRAPNPARSPSPPPASARPSISPASCSRPWPQSTSGNVPYRGIAAMMPDLLGGRVTMVFSSPTTALPLVREGKLRALAVTSLKRAEAAPDLPTMHESGFPGFDATAWFALLAPAGTPQPIVAKLHREAVRILALPEVRKRFGELGMVPMGTSPAEFAAAIKSEAPQWAKVIKASGAKVVE